MSIFSPQHSYRGPYSGPGIGFYAGRCRTSDSSKSLMKTENPSAVPKSRWQRGWRAFIELQTESISGDIEWVEGLRAAFGISLPAAVGLLENHLVWGIICSFATLWLLMCDVGGAYRQKAINLVSSGIVILCAYVFGGWMILSVPNYIIGMFIWVSAAALIGIAGDAAAQAGMVSSTIVVTSVVLFVPSEFGIRLLLCVIGFGLGASAFPGALALGALHPDSPGAFSELREVGRSGWCVLVGSCGARPIADQPGVRDRLRRSDDESGTFAQHLGRIPGPPRRADRPKHAAAGADRTARRRRSHLGHTSRRIEPRRSGRNGSVSFVSDSST